MSRFLWFTVYVNVKWDI